MTSPKLPRHIATLLWVVCAITGAVGCGASGTFRDGVYSDDIVRYRVGAVPAGWVAAEVDDHDVAFQHRELGTIGVNSTCTDYEDVPEQALLNHLLFGTRERVLRIQETVTLDGLALREPVNGWWVSPRAIAEPTLRVLCVGCC